MANMKALFEDDESDEDINVIKINKPYADKYNEWRIKEELQALKGYSDLEVESSESSSEDEDSSFKNRQYVLDYYLTLGSLKSNNPKHKKRYFKESYDGPIKQKEEKPLGLAQYQRNILLQKKGDVSDEEESDEEKPAGYLIKDSDKREEKASQKFAFQDDISDDESDMFTKKEKSKEELKVDKNFDIAEEAVYFIRGQINSMKNKEHENILQHLKDDYQKPDRDEKEKWLDDFFMNNALHPDSEYSDDNCIEDKETLSEDEDTYRKMEEFDTLHRFRYEHDNDELIKNYPRLTVHSSKIKENKRRKKRVEIKERKKKEKIEKIREYKTLKAMDLDIKLKKLQKSAGFDVNFGQEVLDGVFDPDSHSKLMDNLFNDEFYKDESNEDKPVFEDNDKDIYGDYDEWLEKNGESIGANNDGGECSGVGKQNAEDGENDQNDNVEEETAVAEPTVAGSSRRRNQRSKFAEALKKKKRIFDPQAGTFESYYEKHYGLDCEDFIGDMPIKFKYRSVLSNNYGLNTGDILQATDGELNQWVSWKKVAKFERNEQEEKTDHVRYKIKAQNADKMKQILPSLFDDPNDAYADEEEKKRNKYQKKKARKQRQNAERKRKKRHGQTEDNDDALPPTKRRKIDKENIADSASKREADSDTSKSKQIESEQEPVAECSTKQRKLAKKANVKREPKKVKVEKLSAEPSSIPASKKEVKSNGGNKNDAGCSKTNGNIKAAKASTSGIVSKKITAKAKRERSLSITKDKKGKKSKAKDTNENISNLTDLLDESRLTAFNLNPKKAVKRIKHGKRK